jgi:ribosomal-protein-serine acetyltransferase
MKIQIDDDLFLKQLDLEDAPEIFDLVDENRAFLRQWLPWLDGNTTLSDSESFIQFTLNSFQENQNVNFSIHYKNQIVGTVGQHEINWTNKHTTLGYWLGEKFNGKGILTRSLEAVINYSLNTLELNLVTLAAAVENKKSRAIPERLGFSFEGIERQREWLYDHYVDHAIYSLTKSEFSKK